MKNLLVVDKNDKILDYKSKKDCHQLPGVFHRAFSVFVFNKKGELLLQKRSKEKPLWPLFWANSCCSHPIKGGEIKKTAEKRLKEELGFTTCKLSFVGKLSYQACFEDRGCEKEITYVFNGQYDGLVEPDKKEVAEIKWISLSDLENEIKKQPLKYSPWLRKIMKKFENKLLLIPKREITDNMEEFLVKVNSKDKIIGKVSRKIAHQNNKIIHKAVGLVVFDKKGRMLMQKRSKTKDLYPGIWTVSVSGHVGVGEKEEKAILREAKEEIGLQLNQKDIKFLSKDLIKSVKETELMVHFYVIYEGPFKFNKQEIEKLAWFSSKEILEKMKDKRIELTPFTQELFKDKKAKKIIFRKK